MERESRLFWKLSKETSFNRSKVETLLPCLISQVYNWSGSPKHANFNKTVKCLTMVGDKLYCGCSGYSIQVTILFLVDSNHRQERTPETKQIILSSPPLQCSQEIDLEKSTWSSFYSGTRKLLGKQTIYALKSHESRLFAGGSSVDGLAGKV